MLQKVLMGKKKNIHFKEFAGTRKQIAVRGEVVWEQKLQIQRHKQG